MTHSKFLLKSTGIIVLVAGMMFSSCDKTTETEQEVITTIVVHLTGPGFDQEFTWEDLDGDGGNAPVIQDIILPPLTADIQCHLHVYDKSKTPTADITEEIEAESADHLFTFTINTADFTITSNDTDSNGAPFGLETIWQTDQPSTGSVNIKLYHEPTDKNNAANPGGDVDFDVTFPVKIQ
ncbi:MAG: hypothetical protein JNJ57_09735 [Saprospiraceae bacterium]|nr:hypothetical protein [Saprospiraceae bacterium]